MRWKNERDRKDAKFLFAILILFTFWIVFFICRNCESQELKTQYDYESEIRNIIVEFHEHTNKRKLQKVISLAPDIVSYSLQYNYDPLLIATIVLQESSGLITAKSKSGAIGLMQVNSNPHDFDLKTVSGQLQAGLEKLELHHKQCRFLKNTLMAYLTGDCVALSQRRKVNYWIAFYKMSIQSFRKIER